MLLIDKRHINLLVVLFGLLISFASFADEVTPLQLRVIQTRKFAKAPKEVVDAMSANCEDAGGQFIEQGAAMIAERGGVGKALCIVKIKQEKSALLGILKLVDPLAAASASQGNYLQVKYEIKTGVSRSEAVVRIRIINVKDQEQLSDPKVYSDYFKKIGDSLYIQAIEIDPASQE